MKKRLFHACGILSFLCINAWANAQSMKITKVSTEEYLAINRPERSLGYLNDLNTKAVRKFRRDYKEVTGETWMKKEDGLRASFNEAGTKCMVDYDKKGNWMATIRIYGEDLLPAEIRTPVKTTFLDYSVVTVTELQLPRELAYFVKLEDKKNLVTVRVMDGKMDIVEEYVK